MPDGQFRESIGERLKRRYEALKGSTERANFESHWQEIAEVIAPRKLDFVGVRTPGEKRMNRVYDATGIHANEIQAAGLHGMATNPASKWFSLRIIAARVMGPDSKSLDVNDIPEVKQYLADVEEIMWQRLYQPGSNFTTTLHECYLDLGAFGTAVLFVGQRENSGLLFEARALSECVFAENAEGRVDTVFRKTKYTVRQIMQMAQSNGWTPSDTVKDRFRQEKHEDAVEVIHAVYPRHESERDPTKANSENMEFASCYFELEQSHQLSMGGFPEFPYMVPRWSKYSGEIHGRSPGMTALPDVKMLQAMVLTLLKVSHKVADPPMWLSDEGRIGQTRTIPGGINYWRGNPHDGVMLQPTNGNALPITMEILNELRMRIRQTFNVDIMQFTSDANMTATEVMQRTAERMRLLGPLEGRLQSELLGPMIERLFGILNRISLLPPAPEIIAEAEFTVEYVSPLATAQKQQSANGIMQAMNLLVGTFGQELAPQIAMKRLNGEKLVDWAWALFNNDPDLLVDAEAQAEIEEKQAAMEQMKMAQPMVDMAATGAKAIKDVSAANGPSGGMDMGGFMQRLRDEIAADPRAQAEMEAIANGGA